MSLTIIFKCDAAAHICDKSQYKESSLWERIQMKMHHLMCRICRQHSERNTKLSQVIQIANLKTLPVEKKKELRDTIQQEISK